MKKLLFPNGDIQTVYEFKDLDESMRNAEIESIIQFLIETCELDEDGPSDGDDPVQAACRKAYRNQTPWFAGSILWEDNPEMILDMPDLNGWLYDSEGRQLPVTTHVGKNNEVLKYTYGKKEIEIQIVDV